MASHIVSDESLGEPQTNRQLFILLARAGWLEAALADHLSRMAGFRNILVHGYDDVDLAVVEDIVRNRLDDLLEFVASVDEDDQLICTRCRGITDMPADELRSNLQEVIAMFLEGGEPRLDSVTSTTSFSSPLVHSPTVAF